MTNAWSMGDLADQANYDPFAAEKFVPQPLADALPGIAQADYAKLMSGRSEDKSPVIYPIADPRLNITEQSLNNAIDIGMATSGGGLTTKPVMGSLVAMPEVAAPAIVSRANPNPDDINAVLAAAREYGRRGWPTAEREAFKTTPEAYAETTSLVPQISVKDRLPGPTGGRGTAEQRPCRCYCFRTLTQFPTALPTGSHRWWSAGDERLKFYHTGPVIRGLERYGEMPVGDANEFMRNWSGQGAATSPRTQTPPNLRNPSFLTYLRESGNPLTPERYAQEGNTPGFPMMGMHVDLADKFARGAENPLVNPKPFSVFAKTGAVICAMALADTNNISSTLYEMDKVSPGSLPRGWFSSDAAYAKYRSDGFHTLDPGDILDTLGSKTVNKIPRQSEYLPMAEPWYRAAEKVGIAPAEAQSGGWFSYGDITGLQSPPKTITNLLNDQIARDGKGAECAAGEGRELVGAQ